MFVTKSTFSKDLMYLLKILTCFPHYILYVGMFVYKQLSFLSDWATEKWKNKIRSKNKNGGKKKTFFVHEIHCHKFKW